MYIYGLKLEGCKWAKNTLDDNDDKNLTYCNLPILYVTATNRGNKKGGQNRDSGSYRCPVYKYPKRTDKYLVFRVDLACDSPSKWKLRGVALLCSTDD